MCTQMTIFIHCYVCMHDCMCVRVGMHVGQLTLQCRKGVMPKAEFRSSIAARYSGVGKGSIFDLLQSPVVPSSYLRETTTNKRARGVWMRTNGVPICGEILYLYLIHTGNERVSRKVRDRTAPRMTYVM